MKPIKEKDPEKITSEEMRRLKILKEALGVKEGATESEILNKLLNATILKRDQRGKRAGPQLKASLSNLQKLVKISFRNHSGRAKSQETAAESYGVTSNTFKKLREKYKDQWKYIQEKMSGFAKQERELQVRFEECLARTIAEKKRLTDHRENLIDQKDKLAAQVIDQSAVLDDRILLFEILIAEQDDLCRQLKELADVDMEEFLTELADQHFVVPQQN